jgi:hypothetical protein
MYHSEYRLDERCGKSSHSIYKIVSAEPEQVIAEILHLQEVPHVAQVRVAQVRVTQAHRNRIWAKFVWYLGHVETVDACVSVD